MASIQTRPCLISASCIHLISHESEKPIGSKPTEPINPSVLDGFVRKGRDSDISALSELVATCLEREVKNDMSVIYIA